MLLGGTYNQVISYDKGKLDFSSQLKSAILLYKDLSYGFWWQILWSLCKGRYFKMMIVKDRKGKERRGKKQTKQNVKQQPSWNDKNQNKGTTFHTQKKTSEMFQQKEYGRNNYTPKPNIILGIYLC